MPGTPSGLRTDTDVVASPSAEPEPSSATRRKNALARALFGASDSEQSLTPPSPQLTDGPIAGSGGFASERSPLIESSASLRSLRETISPTTYAVNASFVNASATELPDKQLQLAREVQRRTEEAMAQLKKTPSNPKINDGSHRKRIDLSQISGPKLVSASTSVDAIPVRSASVASGHLSASQAQSANSAKLGTRFKKFRGSLRARPATSPSSEESTQHPFEPASTDRSLAGTPDGPHSAIELSRARTSVPSPSATTGPGLKGFVSRFLKPRLGEMPEQDRRKRVPSSASTLEPPSYFGPQKIEQRHERTEPRQGIRSAPPDNKSFRPHTPVSPEEPPSPPIPPPSAQSPAPDESASRAVDENALKQFIDAANNLGLDQDALSEFLGRSTSVGSRLTVQGSKHRSVVSNDKPGNDNGNLALSDPAPLLGTGSSGPRYSVGQPSLRPPGDIIGKAPIRRPSTRNTTTSDANNAVVRRTLIFPAEARQSVLEPGMGLRKSSSTRRRRSASAASTHSNRSLHDRVPTPPPPKSSAARRFSAEQSPPLPLIPNSLMAQTQAISTPQPTSAIPLEKSNSAYDSLQVSPNFLNSGSIVLNPFF
jgi:serine/arginine repetitive matrix protein 2